MLLSAHCQRSHWNWVFSAATLTSGHSLAIHQACNFPPNWKHHLNFTALLERDQAHRISSFEPTSRSLCCSLWEEAEQHWADDTLLSDIDKHWTSTESISCLQWWDDGTMDPARPRALNATLRSRCCGKMVQYHWQTKAQEESRYAKGCSVLSLTDF